MKALNKLHFLWALFLTTAVCIPWALGETAATTFPAHTDSTAVEVPSEPKPSAPIDLKPQQVRQFAEGVQRLVETFPSSSARDLAIAAVNHKVTQSKDDDFKTHPSELISAAIRDTGLTLNEEGKKALEALRDLKGTGADEQFSKTDVQDGLKVAQTALKAKESGADGKKPASDAQKAAEAEKPKPEKTLTDLDLERARQIGAQQALAAQQQQQDKNRGEGGGSSGGSGGGGKGGSGSGGRGSDSGGDSDRGDRGALGNRDLKHFLDKLGAKTGNDSGSSSSKNDPFELAQALRDNKKESPFSSSSKSFDDDKPTPSPSSTPVPNLSANNEPSAQKLPPTPQEYAPLTMIPKQGGGPGGDGGGPGSDGGGGDGGGLGGKIAGAGGGAGSAGGAGDLGGLGSGSVFAGIGSPDMFSSQKFNYTKFGDSDYGSSSGGGGGDGSEGSVDGGGSLASDGGKATKSGKASGPDAEILASTAAGREANGPRGLMSYVGTMVKGRCKANMLQSLCAKGNVSGRPPARAGFGFENTI